jgi:DNA-binding NarL/FixJ family response regulator
VPEAASEASEGAAPIRVVIGDDSDDYRLLLRQSFLFDNRLEVVGEAASPAAVLSLTTSAQPDVVLLDLHMPDGEALEVIPDVLDRAPGTCVVVLSGFTAARKGPSAIAAGAVAYIDKDATTEQIADRIVRLCADRGEETR